MGTQAGGLIRHHQSKLAFIYRISDALIIWHSLYLSAWAYGVPWQTNYTAAALAAMFVFYLVAESMQLYRSWRGVALKEYLHPPLMTWAISVFILLVLGYVTKTTGSYSRVTLGLWVLSAPIALLLWRLCVRHFLSMMRAHGYNSRRVAIVGANQQGAQLAQFIHETPSLGMRLDGFYEDREQTEDRTHAPGQVRVLGAIDDLVRQAKLGQYDLIYVALPMKAEARINKIIAALSDTTTSVYIVPDFFVFNLLHSRWVNVGNMPTISVFESPFFGVEGWVKRLEDIVLSVFILLLIALPMLLISLGVKLSSPGPVFFKQKRYGLDGRRIRVWKFRTMTVSEDGSRVIQAKKNDARITPFGAFLRRTSLDELPQFINVLMGEMSIVGPRPHAVAHNEQYRKLIAGYMLRHKVKPGITGWAQVNGWRGETDTLDKMQKRVDFDLWYIRSWSVMLDLKIIVKTVFKGFVGQNAY
jgi:putative colanic acid biosynthesis UDP-glucose lipid carrier transferase